MSGLDESERVANIPRIHKECVRVVAKDGVEGRHNKFIQEDSVALRLDKEEQA